MSATVALGAAPAVPITTTVRIEFADVAKALASATSDVQADFLNVLADAIIHVCAPHGGINNQLIHVAGGLSQATASVLTDLVWFHDNATKTNVPEAVVARFEENA